MKKLTYEEYRGNKDILMIDLYNGYTIIAIKLWNSEKHNYIVELRIKKFNIEKWDLISKAESLVFETNYKFINSAILKKVSTLYNEGFFDYYIQQYEFEIECFNKGIEMFEEERLQKTVNIPTKMKTIYGSMYFCPSCKSEVEPDNDCCHYCRISLNWDKVK